jgi:hypothetical protein
MTTVEELELSDSINGELVEALGGLTFGQARTNCTRDNRCAPSRSSL